MQEFITHFSYFGVVLVLFASGFGLPIPEDIPLLTAGYLAGHGHADLGIMITLTFLTVLGTDCIVYYMGRRYGHHVPKLPPFKYFLTEKNLTRAEAKFHDHGGKTLFIARFLPGIRMAVFFTAGSFKLPFWKFLAFDGGAALISVPTLVLLGWAFCDHIEVVRQWVSATGFSLGMTAVAVIVIMVSLHLLRRRRQRLASAN